jgi:hypothetical protein
MCVRQDDSGRGSVPPRGKIVEKKSEVYGRGVGTRRMHEDGYRSGIGFIRLLASFASA